MELKKIIERFAENEKVIITDKETVLFEGEVGTLKKLLQSTVGYNSIKSDGGVIQINVY